MTTEELLPNSLLSSFFSLCPSLILIYCKNILRSISPNQLNLEYSEMAEAGMAMAEVQAERKAEVDGVN